MLDHPFGEEIIHDIKPKPPLAPLEAISSCPITSFEPLYVSLDKVPRSFTALKTKSEHDGTIMLKRSEGWEQGENAMRSSRMQWAQ